MKKLIPLPPNTTLHGNISLRRELPPHITQTIHHYPTTSILHPFTPYHQHTTTIPPSCTSISTHTPFPTSPLIPPFLTKQTPVPQHHPPHLVLNSAPSSTPASPNPKSSSPPSPPHSAATANPAAHRPPPPPSTSTRAPTMKPETTGYVDKARTKTQQ